jgi:hypothetical protein
MNMKCHINVWWQLECSNEIPNEFGVCTNINKCVSKYLTVGIMHNNLEGFKLKQMHACSTEWS